MSLWNLSKPHFPSLYTKYEPVNYKKGLELIVAWPLQYGVMWHYDSDTREDRCCSARFFSQQDAQDFCDVMVSKAKPGWHYEVVRLMDDK